MMFQSDNLLFLLICGKVPVKTLLIDGNCRVEDQGVKTHHGHVRYSSIFYISHFLIGYILYQF